VASQFNHKNNNEKTRLSAALSAVAEDELAEADLAKAELAEDDLAEEYANIPSYQLQVSENEVETGRSSIG
jgi:hypothetical protein